MNDYVFTFSLNGTMQKVTIPARSLSEAKSEFWWQFPTARKMRVQAAA